MNTQEKQQEGSVPTQIGDAITRTLDILEKQQDFHFGIPSGFPSLDRLTQGWEPGELVLIGARPAIGKTVLALGMARNAAVGFNVPTAYFSLDLSEISLTKRMIVSETGIAFEKLNGGCRMEAGDWQQMESSLFKLSKAPLYIDDTPGVSLRELRKRVRRLVADQGVRLVFVDDLELLLPDSDDSFRTKAAERDAILEGVKALARELRITIVALTYLRRPTRKNYTGPVLADLEQYWPAADDLADIIILLHRDMFCISEDAERANLMELRVVRNRNGATGTVDLLFDRDRIRLKDLDVMEGVCP